VTTGDQGPRFGHRLDGPSGAPVLVLSNSLGTTTSMWDTQMTELTQFFRVLRYEHRGHGGSPAPAGPYSIADLGGDLLSLLDEHEVEKVSLVGLSLGGMVGMWLAATHPQRIERLVLCCTAPKLGTRESWNERAATVRRQGVASITEQLFGRWFHSGLSGGTSRGARFVRLHARKRRRGGVRRLL